MNLVDVNEFYYDTLKEAFDRVIKKSEVEGITDLNCISIKVPIELDFSNLINYNRKSNFVYKFIFNSFRILAEFYDYFNTARPEDLKGLIRESSVEVLQTMISNMDEEVKLDKRQVSIEIYMKNLPCTSE